MNKTTLEIELDIEDAIIEEIEDKNPTKKDIKKMEHVYSDILNPKEVEIEIEDVSALSDKDKKSLLRISKYIDECRETNRINSREYVKVNKDEEVRELQEEDFSSFGSLSSKDYY